MHIEAPPYSLFKEKVLWVFLLWFIPAAAILALLFAGYKAHYVQRAAPGNDRMQEIAGAIAEGADAFLKSEYKILAIFIVVLFVLIALFIDIGTAVCFLLGAAFSILAGFCGMKVATRANVRTANAAMEHGMNRALSIAFSGGSVMGMCVVGLGLLGCSLIYIITGNYNILFGFSLGASSIALFARVGGGIYTKAADVGADLVGKVEAGIPEDDPRNPAVIADNVGDNVGDVAGMGADLFESYVGALVSALTLGVAAQGALFQGAGALYPLVIAAVGIIASIIATFFVRGKDNSNPHKALKMGSYVSAAIVAVASIFLSKVFFGRLYCSAAIIAGIVVGLVIGFVTEVYTSEDYTSVKRIADQSETGSATTIISGVAVGMKSTWVPILLICIGIYISYSVTNDLYGIALAAVGMLSTTGITVAVDAYGPIADNSGGIAEMSGLDPHVREITDKLDAVGNTTAAMGKGFAIGSAALTALALFVSYATEVKLDVLDLLSPLRCHWSADRRHAAVRVLSNDDGLRLQGGIQDDRRGSPPIPRDPRHTRRQGKTRLQLLRVHLHKGGTARDDSPRSDGGHRAAARRSAVRSGRAGRSTRGLSRDRRAAGDIHVQRWRRLGQRQEVH